MQEPDRGNRRDRLLPDQAGVTGITGHASPGTGPAGVAMPMDSHSGWLSAQYDPNSNTR
jgi:hypothetical protein